MQIRMEWCGKSAAPMALVAISVACLLSAGCNTTGVLTDGVGVDQERAFADSRKPLTPRIANRTVWPHPVGAYAALRQIPPAIVTTAFDAPMTVGVEAMHLVAWTWGGQDQVTMAGYGTWRELASLEPINPLPPLPTAPEDAWMDASPRTGWTVAATAAPAPAVAR